MDDQHVRVRDSHADPQTDKYSHADPYSESYGNAHIHPAAD